MANMTVRYPVPGYPVGTGLVDFVKENPTDALKTVGFTAEATSLAIHAAQRVIGSTGGACADGVEAFGDTFFGVAKGVKGLLGAPLLLVDAGVNFAKGFETDDQRASVKAFMKGAQRTSDALYCGQATVEIIAEPFGGLSATAATANTWMGSVGGLVGVVLAMVGNFMTLADPLAAKAPALVASDGKDVDFAAASPFEQVEVEVFDLKKAEHGSKQTAAWLGLAKNICHLALALIGVIGLIVGAFMGATVASVVIMTLCVAAIAFSALSHINKKHAEACKDQAEKAENFMAGYKSNPTANGDVEQDVDATEDTSSGAPIDGRPRAGSGEYANTSAPVDESGADSSAPRQATPLALVVGLDS
ncbi:MAG: hypothetical protein HY860_03225 [Chlamydiales bacterium]|nr:hypothetical protein [Chlamydiales bacterium]